MTNSIIFLSTCAATGLGAVCRYLLDGKIKKHSSFAIPLGTIGVNMFACFLVGISTFILANSALSSPLAKSLISTGFLGGFSTFSTAMHEGVTLIRQGKTRHAIIHSAAMLAGSLITCSLGYNLGALII